MTVDHLLAHPPGTPCPATPRHLALPRPPGRRLPALAVLRDPRPPFVPGSRWLMVHLVLLGALTLSPRLVDPTSPGPPQDAEHSG